jgi:tetratricopeptide (TPR) repeat protein
VSSFITGYYQELLTYSAARIQQNPTDAVNISTHLALVQLIDYLRSGQKSDFLNLLQQNAIKHDDSLSQFILGMLELEGLSNVIERDEFAGHALIKLAVARQCPFAAITKGVFHMLGNTFVEYDLPKAKYYFLQALEVKPGDIYALRNLGICCLKLGEVERGMGYLKQAHALGDKTLEQVCSKQFEQVVAKMTIDLDSLNQKPTPTDIVDGGNRTFRRTNIPS